MNIEDNLYKFLNLYYHLPQPVSSLLGTLYRQIPRSITMGARYIEFVELCRELAGDENLAAEYINREFVRTMAAAQKTTFYNRLYAEHGVTFSSIKSVDDIPTLPVIDKHALRAHFSELAVPERDGDSLYLSTGGSSGTPVGFMLEKGISRAKETAFIEQIWSSVGYQHGDRIAIIRGIELRKGQKFRREPIKNALMLSSFHITEANLEAYVRELNLYRPKFIQAYPSSIYLVARLMNHLDQRLDFRPEAILCGSENLYPAHVKLVEEIFAAKVLGWYGHAERVLLAQRDAGGGYEFLDSYGISEIVADDGSPVTAGTGTLCGTSLNNSVMPLIRYKTDDIATLAPAPSAPSAPRVIGTGLTVASIDGRKHEFVFASDGRPVSMTAINIHSDEFDSLERFQFVQKQKGIVSFEYTSAAPLADTEKRAIEGILTSKLGDGFEFSVHRVEKLELSRNGKQSFLRQGIKPV
jgi:phenylacetate-CoA ligase